MKDILILHGWGSSAGNWQRVKEGLERKNYRVHVPDLPGFGQNSALEKPWSLDDYVNWLEGYCEKNNLSQFFLLGHSFGGSLAVKFSLKHPDKIEKMFLVSPALIREKTFRRELTKKLAKALSFSPLFFKKIVYKKIFRSDYPLFAGPMRETFLQVINEDLLQVVSAVSVKTFLIWGEKDKATPLKHALLLEKNIPGSELDRLPGIYHNPHTENPELLVEKVLKKI